MVKVKNYATLVLKLNNLPSINFTTIHNTKLQKIEVLRKKEYYDVLLSGKYYYMENKPLAFVVFFSVLTLSMFASTLSTFVMQSVSYYHQTSTSAGTLESYQNLSMIVFLLALFSVIIKLGYKKSLLLIISIMIIIAIAMPLVNQYFMFKIYLVGLGLIFVAMKVIIYSTAPLACSNERTQAMLLSFLEFSWAMASLAAMWVMAYFLKHHPGNWLWFTWIFAAFGIVTIILWCFIRLDNSAIKNEQGKSMLKQLGEIGHLCKNRYVIALIVVAFFANFVEMGVITWLPGFYKEAINISGPIAIKIASFGLLASMLGRLTVIFVLIYLSFGRTLFLYYTVGLVILAYALFNMHVSHMHFSDISHIPFIAWLLVSFLFFVAPSTPLLNSSILSKMPKAKHILLMTLLTIIFAIASSLGARIIGMLIDRYGVIHGFKIATITPMIILIIIVLPYEKLLNRKSNNKNL